MARVNVSRAVISDFGIRRSETIGAMREPTRIDGSFTSLTSNSQGGVDTDWGSWDLLSSPPGNA